VAGACLRPELDGSSFVGGLSIRQIFAFICARHGELARLLDLVGGEPPTLAADTRGDDRLQRPLDQLGCISG